MFTVDASVHINALNVSEAGSTESQAFLVQLYTRAWPVFSPTLLLVEVAAVIARAKNDTEQGIAMAHAIYGLPGQTWVPLDDALAEEAIHLAAERRLRGADAIYAAVARRYGAILVTRDRQQLERLSSVLRIMTPFEALVQLAEMAKASENRE